VDIKEMQDIIKALNTPTSDENRIRIIECVLIKLLQDKIDHYYDE
jgi:hypothetical protein